MLKSIAITTALTLETYVARAIVLASVGALAMTI